MSWHPTFAGAHAEFQSCYAAENSLPDGHTDEDVDAASDRTTEALRALCAIPASSPAEALQKLDAVMAIYGCFFDRVPLASAIAEVRSTVHDWAKEIVDAIPAAPAERPVLPAAPRDTAMPTHPWAWVNRLRASRWAWIEPWYDYGSSWVFSHRPDEAEGDGRHFGFDWLGLHLMLVFGRTPRDAA